MRTVTLEELLEAGCHFGHQVTRQNAKARDFIFEARDGIHIIDLEKTKEGLEEAGKFIKELAKRNGILIILGTKRQAEGAIGEEIKRAQTENAQGLYFVTKRWIGGTLTNFSEVSKNFRKLKELTRKLQDESAKTGYTKKEIGEWEKSRVNLENFYGGIADLPKIPDALFIIDTHLENLAVREAMRMNIPVVGVTDTNADPTIIDYPIPANDDAVGSIKLIVNYIIDAWIEGKKNVESKDQNPESSDKHKGTEEKKASEQKDEKVQKENPKKEEKKDDKVRSVKEKGAVKEKKKTSAKAKNAKK